MRSKLGIIIISIYTVCVLGIIILNNMLYNCDKEKNIAYAISNNVVLSIGEDTSSENLINVIDKEIRDEQYTEKKIEASVTLYKKDKIVNGLKTRYRDELKLSKEDMNILYRIVEAEAGGEDMQGRMLIANVVINRYMSNSFPDTIKGVVFANNGKTYQFSPVKNGRFNTVKVSELTKKAVRRAVKGEDNSSGAEYFMARPIANSKNVTWFDTQLQFLFKHGCHEFFKK